MMKNLALAVGLVGTLAGVLSAQQPQRVYTSGGTFEFRPQSGFAVALVIGAPDSVFAAFHAVLEEMGLKNAQIDPRSRELGISRLRMVRRLGKRPLSNFLSCGEGLTGPNADTWHVFLTLGAQVVAAPKGAQLELRFNADAVDVPNGRSDRLPCSSTGILELQIVDRLNERFGGSP